MTTRTEMPELIDNDGNVIPAPAPDSSLGQLIYLLEYARRRNFPLGPIVQVGEVVVQLRDPVVGKPLSASETKTIWQENGHDEGDV